MTLPPTIRAPYKQNKELCWQPQSQSYHSSCILFTSHNTSLRWHRIFVERFKVSEKKTSEDIQKLFQSESRIINHFKTHGLSTSITFYSSEAHRLACLI